ncbi:8719_t:CDS:1 [Scutellospora calospora]|uniref:8719_t:CDS:1 n=1 Tax=Scutellospora calospora TaxID=85575 RepID=A0ACA9MQM6_9GLOM|nr:8719_t:CDS:1 [Scutellospora calospora]
MADLDNIQFENEQTIHQNSMIKSNLKRKFSNLDNKTGRKLHEIQNYFCIDKSKLVCLICKQSYVSNTSVKNLKNHFKKNHNEEYIEFLNNQQEEINQTENNQQELEAERLFQEEINKKRRKYKRIILENVVIEADLFNLFITGLDAENIIIQK